MNIFYGMILLSLSFIDALFMLIIVIRKWRRRLETDHLLVFPLTRNGVYKIIKEYTKIYYREEKIKVIFIYFLMLIPAILVLIVFFLL